MAPLNLDIYGCEWSEQEKTYFFKIENKNKKKQQQKKNNNNICCYESYQKLCFGDFSGGGRGTRRAPPLESASGHQTTIISLDSIGQCHKNDVFFFERLKLTQNFISTKSVLKVFLKIYSEYVPSVTLFA